MRRYRAVVAYDGTAYLGFQRQAHVPTIQGTLEQALARITGTPTTIIGAGRTDTGVHARGQVIAFTINWSHSDADLLRALNAVLPQDIALQTLATCAETFHPRFDATSRVYEYTLLNAPQRQPLWQRQAWWVQTPLNVAAMQDAAALLLGAHDFATFGQPPYGSSTVRELFVSHWTISAEDAGQRAVYRIEGTAFLQHMVRRIVGMLVEVGRGLRSVQQFEQAFRAADLAQAGMLAPPQGLVLHAVYYAERAAESRTAASPESEPAGDTSNASESTGRLATRRRQQ